MAATVTQPPTIMDLNRDYGSSSSNASVYTMEAHNRITSGDFVFQQQSMQSKPTSKAHNHPQKPIKKVNLESDNSTKRMKPIKEFTVQRKNSYRGPHYYRLNLKHQAKSTAKTAKRNSKFETMEQINPIFDIFPQSTLLESPTYMVEYFCKKTDLIKKEPSIHYKILKAQIENNVSDDGLIRTKQRKYQSLPVLKSHNEISVDTKELPRKQRTSMPVTLAYKPTNMVISEYLNTPLDFYSHRKKNSQASGSDESKATKLTEKSHGSSGAKTKSSGSGNASVATSALSLNRSKIIEAPYKMKSRSTKPLETKRKDDLLRRRSVRIPYDSEKEDKKVDPKLELLAAKKRHYLSKLGTPILETGGSRTFVENEIVKKQRHSDSAEASIENGDEIFRAIRDELINQGFSDWNGAQMYLGEKYPDLVENSYFLTRLMLEIYLRRVVAARILLKLGSDMSNKGTASDVWAGLKESISIVYGKDNAMFFESQNT